MILVHRLRGEPLYVNADLIETIEATPDTALCLVDGRRILVDETPEVVIERFLRLRASLLVAADGLRDQAIDAAIDPAEPQLSVVPDEPTPEG